jgi:hypothetical protein
VRVFPLWFDDVTFGFQWVMLPPAKQNGRRVVVPDRLGVAWEAFRALSASERREFINMLREWHLARRIEAVAARGGNYG